MNMIPLTSAIWIMGFISIIAQILALREFLVVFQGNELSIGIVLGNWLLLVALGSALGGRIADRSKEPVRIFAGLQMAVSLLLPITILCIRMSRDLLGFPPWEAIGPIRVWTASFLVLGPIGLCEGAAFSFGCEVFSRVLGEQYRAPGIVYILEAIGSVCGGIMFTYLLVGHLHSLKTTLLIGAFNILSALLFLGQSQSILEKGSHSPVPEGGIPQRSRYGIRIQQSLCLLILMAAAILAFTPLADRLHLWSLKVRWKGLDMVESADSVYGNISVFKMGEQLSFYQNGIPAITTPIPDITSVEEMVHLSLLFHDDPKTILFLGGGLGGALAETLKHPISDLYYTELDPLVIKMVQRFPSTLTNRELEDQRTHVRYEDGRLFLLKTDLGFDAILINLPDATTLLLNRFFTMEFFALIRKHLNPGGLLALTSPGSTSYLSEELMLLNRSALDTLRQIFRFTKIIPGDRNLLLASNDIPLDSLTPEMLASRMTRKGIEAAVLSTFYIKFKMDPVKAMWLDGELNKVRHARINQDFSPALLYYFLAYKNAQLHNRWRSTILALDRIRAHDILFILVVLNIPALVWFLAKKGGRFTALSFSIFSTGFVGMTMEIILILAFQTLYGYIYHWVGILVASFMGGLGLGAFLVNRRLERVNHGYKIFLLLEILLICIILTVFLGLHIPSRISLEGHVALGLFKALFVFISIISGFLVGAEFPLANREALKHHKGVSRIAGRLYALDLAGAWLGTTLVSVLFVPLIGIPQTLLLIVVLKTFCLLYLLLAR